MFNNEFVNKPQTSLSIVFKKNLGSKVQNKPLFIKQPFIVFFVPDTVQVIGSSQIIQAQTFPLGSHSLDSASLLPNEGPCLGPHQIYYSVYQGTCIEKETFCGGDTHLFFLCCISTWDFCVFVSLYLRVVRKVCSKNLQVVKIFILVLGCQHSQS